VGGLVSAHYLARPIMQLRDATNKISTGDFSYRISNIPETRELADLAVDFNSMTANLSSLITDLERRVSERTEAITRKTEQLRAASYIARQTSEIQDMSLLLNRVVKLVSDQFGYYHTGIFLLNVAGDEVTLQAASSEGGRHMIEKGHSLKVGTQGIVGYVAGQKKPRIALDVGTDAAFFNNPHLPMTRSEIALPLLVRSRLLGVLDIQSDKTAAFSIDDMDVLETLADQVAVAIDNAKPSAHARRGVKNLRGGSAYLPTHPSGYAPRNPPNRRIRRLRSRLHCAARRLEPFHWQGKTTSN
jgi:nitrate/nitrite-specific signal transduction histidine kinase